MHGTKGREMGGDLGFRYPLSLQVAPYFSRHQVRLSQQARHEAVSQPLREPQLLHYKGPDVQKFIQPLRVKANQHI